MQTTYYPRARRAELSVQELPGETLVFDRQNDQANCLNATAALVWKYADGTRTVPEIAREMSQTLDTPVDARVVWYALEQLSNKQLLEERAPVPVTYGKMTRRAFLTRAGLVGAAVAIPVIVSIAAPSPAHAQSACLPDTTTCVSSEQCCSECCSGGTCQPFNFCLP